LNKKFAVFLASSKSKLSKAGLLDARKPSLRGCTKAWLHCFSPLFPLPQLLRHTLKKRSFLLLELLIGLYLVGLCVLPLAQLPIKALAEETKAAYRMQMHRFADLAFAEIKEKLYRQEISWKQISSSSKHPAIIPFKSDITISFEPLGSRQFYRQVTLHSIGKKTKSGEEWRLVIVKVNFKAHEKKFILSFHKKDKSIACFAYRVLVKKSDPVNLSQ
jgi:hypothetical protein